MYNLFVKANKKRAKRKGFTLIELVIVIVILGVLAGVAALSFQNVTQSSKDGVAKANLRAMKSAAQVYQADHNGLLPDKKGDLKKYLDDNLQKNINVDAATAVEGYTYTVKKVSDGIELIVTSTNLKGTAAANDGSYYKLTGEVDTKTAP